MREKLRHLLLTDRAGALQLQRALAIGFGFLERSTQLRFIGEKQVRIEHRKELALLHLIAHVYPHIDEPVATDLRADARLFCHGAIAPELRAWRATAPSGESRS